MRAVGDIRCEEQVVSILRVGVNIKVLIMFGVGVNSWKNVVRLQKKYYETDTAGRGLFCGVR